MADVSENKTGTEVYHRHARKHSLLALIRGNNQEKCNLPVAIENALTSTKDPYLTETLDRLRTGEILCSVSRNRVLNGNQARFCRLDKDLLYFRYSLLGCGCRTSIGRKREKKVDLRRIRVRPGIQESSVNVPLPAKGSNYFSIIFDNSSRLPLSFIAPSCESAKDWVDGLNYLKRKISSIKPHLQFQLAAWELFNNSTSTRDGHVTLREAKSSLVKHGLSMKRDTSSRYAAIKTSLIHHTLCFPNYFELYQDAFSRKEINEIFHCVSADKASITVRELYKFIQETQKEEKITELDCEEIIQNYELNDCLRTKKLMSNRGFNLYMMSSRCELFNWRHDTVYQDMSQPLPHYYIASSHNTYLTGDQLTDPSSVDAYMNVLLKGCRCVELDCWDGPEGEPQIYHGYTLTSKLKFKDVVEVIGRYAFEVSDYPLILSLENHCSLAQQDKMAFYLKTILGSELLTSPLLPLDEICDLPSPSALRGKILIKGKALSRAKHGNELEDSDGAEEDVDMTNLSKTERAWMQQSVFRSSFRRNKSTTSSFTSASSFRRNKSNSASFTSTSTSTSYSFMPNWKVSPSLSELVVYCKSVKFSSFDVSQANITEMSSFSEGKWKRLTKAGPHSLIELHKHKLSRTYPGGSRTDSSNYDPQPLWNLGFQLVALNYQTKCEEMDINNGKFRQNGNCGYLLKPEFQRLSSQKCNANENYLKSLKIQILSGPDGGSYCKRNYLMLEVVVSGDRDDFIRRTLSCAGEQESKRGFPVDFEHVVYTPELAMVRFILKDTSKMREKIGQYTLPLTSITQGYRHIPFFDNSGTRMAGVSVLVYVSLEDIQRSVNAKPA